MFLHLQKSWVSLQHLAFSEVCDPCLGHEFLMPVLTQGSCTASPQFNLSSALVILKPKFTIRPHHIQKVSFSNSCFLRNKQLKKNLTTN